MTSKKYEKKKNSVKIVVSKFGYKLNAYWNVVKGQCQLNLNINHS